MGLNYGHVEQTQQARRLQRNDLNKPKHQSTVAIPAAPPQIISAVCIPESSYSWERALASFVLFPPNDELTDDEERAKGGRLGIETASRSSSFGRAIC